MNEMTPATAIGHNVSPVFDEDAFAELEERTRELADAAGAWGDIGEIASEGQAERLAELLSQVGKHSKDIDARRKLEKEPHLTAGRTIDTAFKGLDAVLQKVQQSLKPMMQAWMTKKRQEAERARQAELDRLKAEQEEAARVAREAEARNDVFGQAKAEEQAEDVQKQVTAAARAKPTGKVKGASGGRTMSLAKSYEARITNVLSALRHYQNEPTLIEELVRLANRDARTTKGEIEIPGVAITAVEKVR